MIQRDLFSLEGLQKEMSWLHQMQFHSWHPLPAPLSSSLKELKNKTLMLHRNHLEH